MNPLYTVCSFGSLFLFSLFYGFIYWDGPFALLLYTSYTFIWGLYLYVTCVVLGMGWNLENPIHSILRTWFGLLDLGFLLLTSLILIGLLECKDDI